jgi:hypothetical protein
MSIQTVWRKITATRYTRALEAEVARLRAENRALLNSILGIAGVPPITVLPDSVSTGAPAAAGLGRSSGSQTGRAGETLSMTMSPAREHAQGPSVVMPMRRRSWHQIYRMLEIDSARKKPQEEINTAPASTRG